MIYEREVMEGIRVIEKVRAIKIKFSYNGEFDSALGSVITKYNPSIKQVYKGLERFEKNEKKRLRLQMKFENNEKNRSQIVSLDSLLSNEAELIEQHEEAILQDQIIDNAIRVCEDYSY